MRASRALVAETLIHKSDDPQHLVSLSLKEKLQLQGAGESGTGESGAGESGAGESGAGESGAGGSAATEEAAEHRCRGFTG